MGDRGNIAIVQHGDHGKSPQLVYLYSHWGGYELPQSLQNALKRGNDRWTDEAYLARIIFCEMVGNAKNLTETTGLGITTYMTDNEYPLLVVDTAEQTVSVTPPDDPFSPSRTVSFADFVNLDKDALKGLRGD